MENLIQRISFKIELAGSFFSDYAGSFSEMSVFAFVLAWVVLNLLACMISENQSVNQATVNCSM